MGAAVKTTKKKMEVLSLFQKANDEELEAIVWTCCAYPMACWRICLKQLKDISERAGGDVATALKIATDEIVERVEEFNRNNP
jgi:hypothetical protein